MYLITTVFVVGLRKNNQTINIFKLNVIQHNLYFLRLKVIDFEFVVYITFGQHLNFEKKILI